MKLKAAIRIQIRCYPGNFYTKSNLLVLLLFRKIIKSLSHPGSDLFAHHRFQIDFLVKQKQSGCYKDCTNQPWHPPTRIAANIGKSLRRSNEGINNSLRL